MDIWYVFLRSTGDYMGSGTPHYDDVVYGSTLDPVPDYDSDTQTAHWDGTAWMLRPSP